MKLEKKDPLARQDVAPVVQVVRDLDRPERIRTRRVRATISLRAKVVNAAVINLCTNPVSSPTDDTSLVGVMAYGLEAPCRLHLGELCTALEVRSQPALAARGLAWERRGSAAALDPRTRTSPQRESHRRRVRPDPGPDCRADPR